VHCLNSLNGFQFDNHFVVNQNVQAMLTNYRVLVENIVCNLSLNRTALGLQFQYESVFVNPLKEPWAEFPMH